MMDILYDVCNDYSLDPSEEPEPDHKVYSRRRVGQWVVYRHRKDDEVHFVKGPAGHKGTYFPCED